MAAGKPGTSNLNTLTRAVANIVRHEDRAVSRAAIAVLLRAYDDADHNAGRTCYTAGRGTSGGPEPETHLHEKDNTK